MKKITLIMFLFIVTGLLFNVLAQKQKVIL